MTLLLPDEPPETPQITFKNKTDDIPTAQLFGTPNNAPKTQNPVEPEPHIQPKTQNEKIQELLQTPDTHKYVTESFNWWSSPLNGKRDELKFEMNPNDL